MICALVASVLVLFASPTFAQVQTNYFPPSIGRGYSRWFSMHLSALQEPPIWHSAQNTSQTYRFIWLRTWHHPVAVRVDVNTDGSGVLVCKVTSGTGGYNAGQLSFNNSRTLTNKEVAELVAKFESASFWALATDEPSGGRDGARWVLEAAKDGQYHVLHRWTPKKGVVRGLGMYMLKLSRLDVPKDDIY